MWDKKEEHEEAEIIHTQVSQPYRDCASAGACPRLRAQATENRGGFLLDGHSEKYK